MFNNLFGRLSWMFAFIWLLRNVEGFCTKIFEGGVLGLEMFVEGLPILR